MVLQQHQQIDELYYLSHSQTFRKVTREEKKNDQMMIRYRQQGERQVINKMYK